MTSGRVSLEPRTRVSPCDDDDPDRFRDQPGRRHVGAPPGAQPRARRHPRRRGRGDDAVPRRRRVQRRRLPQHRHVLRPLGLPHHQPPARRVDEDPGDRAGPVLGPPGAAVAARAVPDARRRRPVRGAVRGPHRARPHPHRRPGQLRLRGQLALRVLGPVVLRALRRALADAPPLVARGRGAVLPGLAADGVRRADVASGIREAATRGHRHPDGRVGRVDGDPATSPAPTRRASTTAPTRVRSRCCSARRSGSCCSCTARSGICTRDR